MENIVDSVFKAQFVLASVGVLMNIPHLIILLHTSMRTSSTNSLLIGIAISDIIMLGSISYDRIHQLFISPFDNSCAHIATYHYQMSQWIGTFWSDILEQTSLWFGVFLALIRLLIMKLPGRKERLSCSKTGYFIVIVITLTTSLLSVYFYFAMKQDTLPDSWKNGEKCSGFPANFDETIYKLANTSQAQLEKAVNSYVLVSGVSQILISLIYPLLTILLFFEIRKSAKFASGAMYNKKNQDERNRSAKMILAMTVFYVIYSAPSGIIDFTQLFVDDYVNVILETLVDYGSVFSSTLFCLNAMSHSVINFLMSSKYRKTLKGMLKLRNKIVSVAVSGT